jgi:hypothetical protein
LRDGSQELGVEFVEEAVDSKTPTP